MSNDTPSNSPLILSIAPEMCVEIRNLVHDGKNIAAIQTLREVTGLSLVEAIGIIGFIVRDFEGNSTKPIE